MSLEKTDPETQETVTKEEPPAPKAKAAPAKGGTALSQEAIVAAIKGMTVMGLAELVKRLESELGVSAAAPVVTSAMVGAGGAFAAAAPAAPPAEEQTEFNVILQEIGPNKINVIKVVREVTALGLREAKELVESAPKVVKEALNKAEAQALKEKLEGVGAKAEVK